MENTNIQMTENMPVVPQVTESTEPAVSTLADVIGAQTSAPEQVQNEEAIPMQEPGWYAKRRQKDRADWEAENNAKMAPVLSQLAQLQEYRLGVEADKLVASGKISDRDMAIEYLRNKEGIPAPVTATPSTPPRDEQGRFVAKNPEPNAAVKQRANMLFAQAGNIKDATGVDVMAIYNTDPDVKAKVLSGEWDFTNVLMQYKAEEPADAPAHTAPAPVRSANGIGMGGVDIRHMSGEQFRKLNEFLASGGRVDVRK